MSASDPEDFLRYYQNEMTYLRKMGSAFAEKYPRVAPRLELGADECRDPQIERLLESFAFLTARIQQNLDGEFPELTTALLGTLYPHFVSPVPAMAIAQFKVDPTRCQQPVGHRLDKGLPLFAHASPQDSNENAQQAHAADHPVCRFRTCYPVQLWPLTVVKAGFEHPAQFDFLDDPHVLSVLRLQFSYLSKLPELELDRLRFYLDGNRAMVSALYELLFCNVRGVMILPDQGLPVRLPSDAIRAVGFEPGEDVLPHPQQAHPGYRLLQEYFVFPEKFHFFEIDHLKQRGATQQLDLLILFDRLPKERLAVDEDTFKLGCTPIINLFPKTTEPIRLDHRQTEYRLVADMRRERTTEIHSIRKVSASPDPGNAGAEAEVYEPFFSYNHAAAARQHKAFWIARRRATGRKELAGTDLYLSFLDLTFRPAHPPVQTVFAHTLCTNRELATQLPLGAKLELDEGAPLHGVKCLTAPTRPLYPPLRGATLWKLVSHLSLNYLSLSNQGDGQGEGHREGHREGLKALQEILRLYSFSDQPSVSQQINGLSAMHCSRVVRHIGEDAWRGFCRGHEIKLEFDESFYVGSSAFLLGAVLNRFFALYAAINSFTELRITSKQRQEEWKQWPPMAGEKIIL